MEQQYIAQVDSPPNIRAAFFPEARTVADVRAQMRRNQEHDPKLRYGTIFRARLIASEADLHEECGSFYYFRQGIVPGYGYRSQFFVIHSDRAAWESTAKDPWEEHILYRCDEVV